MLRMLPGFTNKANKALARCETQLGPVLNRYGSVLLVTTYGLIFDQEQGQNHSYRTVDFLFFLYTVFRMRPFALIFPRANLSAQGSMFRVALFYLFRVSFAI